MWRWTTSKIRLVLPRDPRPLMTITHLWLLMRRHNHMTHPFLVHPTLRRHFHLLNLQSLRRFLLSDQKPSLLKNDVSQSNSGSDERSKIAMSNSCKTGRIKYHYSQAGRGKSGRLLKHS
ncbi:hypothetical protein BDR07DRAFT_1426537, partial [Suillus spraguei]